MNKEVTVTGMQLNTKVSDNLLISDDTLTSTARKGDDTFYNSLVQLAGGLIEPVSTVNAKAFFYTAGTNVQGNGNAINDEYSAYDPDDRADFISEYALPDGTDAVGYVDYVYQLKAINGATASEIRLTQLDLTYGGDGDNSQKAYRIGIFAEDLGYKTGADDTNLVAPAGAVDALSATIFTPASAANFDAGKAVSSTTELDNVTYYNGSNYNSTYFSLDVGTNRTQYYKIVVRVWLEGEDQTCNNTTFMDLTDKWSLDMKWELTADATPTAAAAEGQPANGAVIPVVNIAQATTASKIDLTTGTTVAAAAAAVNIDNNTLYAITKAGTTNLYSSTAGSITSASHIYQLVDGHPIEITNQCTLPTT